MNNVAVGLLVSIAALARSVGSAPAWEHRGRGAFVHGSWGPRVFLGPTLWYPYTPAPVIVEPPPPQVYGQPPPATPQYWYYCESPRGGYYPYVPQCPGGWPQMVPRTGPPAS